MWIAKAAKRPLVLFWDNWEGVGAGLVPKCESRVFLELARAVDVLNMQSHVRDV